MIIGIVADTHDNTKAISKAVKILSAHNVELVIHLGDVVSPLTLTYFKGFNMKLVKGNCDGDIEGIEDKAKELGLSYEGKSLDTTIDGKRIFALHGDHEILLKDVINSQEYDYVLYGHTHKARDEKIGKTRVINPGSLYMGDEENSIAVLDTASDTLKFFDVEGREVEI